MNARQTLPALAGAAMLTAAAAMAQSGPGFDGPRAAPLEATVPRAGLPGVFWTSRSGDEDPILLWCDEERIAVEPAPPGCRPMPATRPAPQAGAAPVRSAGLF